MYGGGDATGYICPTVVVVGGDICLLLDEPRAAVLAADVAVGGIIVVFLGRKM